ncbi:MAG TPA: hypothetical protein VKH45_09100 [Candidatus Acidoferrum sp.]|nr:hypothetical protein [Candidatus Acidoferrum sp.]
MRNRFAIATAAALILSLGIWAQEKQVQDPAESKQLNMQAYIGLLRTDLQVSKRLVIKESMQLDDKQGELFWPLYNQYDVEQTKLADEKLALIEAYAHDFLTMNDQKADQLANQALLLEDKRLALRRKYYELMKKSLPTTVVVRFFQLQNQIDLIVDLQIASHLPIIEEAPPKQ